MNTFDDHFTMLLRKKKVQIANLKIEMTLKACTIKLFIAVIYYVLYFALVCIFQV